MISEGSHPDKDDILALSPEGATTSVRAPGKSANSPLASRCCKLGRTASRRARPSRGVDRPSTLSANSALAAGHPGPGTSSVLVLRQEVSVLRRQGRSSSDPDRKSRCRFPAPATAAGTRMALIPSHARQPAEMAPRADPSKMAAAPLWRLSRRPSTAARPQPCAASTELVLALLARMRAPRRERTGVAALTVD